MGGPGNRFEVIPDHIRYCVPFNEEPLLSHFYVEGSRRVDEPEDCRRIYDFDNSTDVERPQSQSPRLNGDHFTYRNSRMWTCNSHPAQIEHFPLNKCTFCNVEGANTGTDT